MRPVAATPLMEVVLEAVPWWPFGQGATVVLGGIAALLLLGTLWRVVRAAGRPEDGVTRERLRSLESWWVLFGLFLTILVLGRTAVAAGMAAVSLLLLRDTLRLAGRLSWYPAVAIVSLVAFVLGWWLGGAFFGRIVPLATGLLVLVEVLRRTVRSRAGSAVDARPVAPAFLLGTIGPLYATGVALLPSPSAGPEVGLGWFMLLVILTELNDSAQAWWGRLLGAHRMTPRLSPGKTWEGLVGGLATTCLAAILVGPLLTPYGRAVPFGGGVPGTPWLWCLGFALVLGLGGVVGDLLGSMAKRRAGVKDSGTLIPGQGGVLDRIDSLTLTAPLFYLLTHLYWLG